MSKNESSYFSDLSNNQLFIQPIEPLLDYMGDIIELQKIPSFLHKKGEYGEKVTNETKMPICGRVELENLFLQGLEHRNWLERNKMTVKFLFDRGPLGKRVNTRKRVRLILGFCDEEVPNHFSKIREKAEKRDPYLEINFVRMFQDGDGRVGLEVV